MLKRFLASLFLLLFSSTSVSAFALLPEATDVPVDSAEELELAAEPFIDLTLNADASVQVGRSIIFDAQLAEELEGLNFEWTFGDGNRQQGSEVVHSYNEAGNYQVTLVVRDQQGQEATYVHSVFAYEQAFVLATNVSEEDDLARVNAFVDLAREQGIFVELLESSSAPSEFLAEELLKRQFSENLNVLSSAENIIVWTTGTAGLTVFSQLQQSIDDKNFFEGKDIFFISDEHFGSLANIARGVYDSIRPDQIILTRWESILVLLDATTEEFVEILEERGIQYEVVGEGLNLRPWNIVSYFVNTMINHGMPTNTIQLILMLPVIVTVVAFMKQVVGLTTLGVYTPSILALSFIALDLSYGLLLLFAILFTGTVVRLFLRRYRLLYIPRMAIVLTAVSIVILFILFVGSYFDIADVVGIAVFPMLIMSTMAEKFISIQSGKGLKRALIIMLEAVAVAVLCYYVAEWPWLKVVVLGHPEIIFLFLLADVLLARWAGLRLMEYVRFREIIRHAEE